MPTYETLCVLHPELPETRIKEVSAWIGKILEGAQGTVLQMNDWGYRDLAYRTKKQRRGYFLRVEYNAPSAAVRELERNLRISENVLRYLSTVRSGPTVSPTATQPQATPPSSPSVAPPAVVEGQPQ